MENLAAEKKKTYICADALLIMAKELKLHYHSVLLLLCLFLIKIERLAGTDGSSY